MIIDRITNAKNYVGHVKHLANALDYISGNYDLEEGVYHFDGGRIIVAVGESQALSDKQHEVHRDYADVMLILEGSEIVGYAANEDMSIVQAYKQNEDIAFYEGKIEDILVTVPAGYFYIMMPGEGHKPCVHVDEAKSYRKYIIKCRQAN